MADKAMRCDRVELRRPVRTPQGFLRVDGFVSRAGIYEYVNTADDERAGYGKAGTVRRELRPEEEVSREDSLAGFEGATVTANHPKQMITPQNARSYEVGTVTSARYDAASKRVVASMVIKDPSTIAKVEGGELNELSPGYKAAIVRQSGVDHRFATPGNPEGRYDVIQREIEVNHQALVSRARGGSDMRLRLDGVDDVAIEQTAYSADSPRGQGPTMADELEGMSPDEQIRFLKTKNVELKARADELDAQLATKTKEASVLRGQAEVAQNEVNRLTAESVSGFSVAESKEVKRLSARVDELELELQQERGEVGQKRVAARAERIVRVKTALGHEHRTDGMSDRALDEAIIKRYEPKARLDGDDDYIASRASAVYEARMKNAESLSRAGEVLSGGSQRREVRVDSKEARAEAWRNQALNPSSYQAAFGRNEEA